MTDDIYGDWKAPEGDSEPEAPEDERRKHRRYETAFPVRYWCGDDNAWTLGKVRNLSQGGMAIRTRRRHETGEVLHAMLWAETGQPSERARFLTASVQRVQPIGGGIFEVGVRFLAEGAEAPPVGGQAEQDRRHRRLAVDLPATYVLPDRKTLQRARVINVSQGGLLLLMPEAMNLGDTFSVTVHAHNNEFFQADLVGRARVAWVEKRETAWEVGCRFLNAYVKGRDVDLRRTLQEKAEESPSPATGGRMSPRRPSP